MAVQVEAKEMSVNKNEMETAKVKTGSAPAESSSVVKDDGVRPPVAGSSLWSSKNLNIEILHNKDKDGNIVQILANSNAHDVSLHKKEYPTEFTWTTSPEPHAVRRKEIIAKYPQIKELYGPDPWAGLFCLCTVLFQLFMAYMMRDASWYTLLFFGYTVSGTLNHSLQLAMHELSHDLMFPKRWQNQLMGYIANIPGCVASYGTFRRYHLEHHTNQGDDFWDADLPTYMEAMKTQGPAMKALYLIAMPIFYGVRPLLARPKNLSSAEIYNWCVIAPADLLIFHFMGGRSLAYLALGSILGLGLHPMSGHFLEHTEFIEGQETYSYYGPLNYLCYNVGYHNEHHDFPRIPGRKLPQLKKIAGEYYDNLPYYTSWTHTLYAFIFNKNVNVYCRVKRTNATKEE